MSQIRSCFTSRFEHGMLFEVDYSQLEIVALAFLSGDVQLKKDIKDNVDMHLVSLSNVTGEDYEVLKARYDSGDKDTILARKAAKRPSFELQYGASANTIAINNNWSKNKAVEYINRYYSRYPEVKHWQDEVAREVEDNKTLNKSWVSNNDPMFKSFYKCPHTGRIYVFTSRESKYGNSKFLPTQMKNYPVQGFATGDLVPTVGGAIVRYLHRHSLHTTILPIVTVHDSFMFDVDMQRTSFGSIVRAIDDTVGRTKEIMEEYFDVVIDVPLRYTVSTGANWNEMKEVSHG